jgi:hypothetical protein
MRRADQMPRQRSGFKATVLVELAKMRHRLLDDAPAHANTAHQPPIPVNLPVLLANRMAQIHALKRI